MRLHRSPEPSLASPSEVLIAATVLAVIAASTPAQRQFDELRKRGLPVDYDVTTAVALGDVDGDGDLDLIACGSMRGNAGVVAQNRLYLNNGTGRFVDATAGFLPADVDWTWAVALGDVDGDRDIDVVFGNGRQNRLYLNDGTGRFADATALHLPADNDSSHGAALGDVDGDGDLDLCFGNFNVVTTSQDRLYLNDGSGTFTDATAARMPVASVATEAVAFGDVDGDLDPDLILGIPGQTRLYLNDGAGTFADVTAARVPPGEQRTLGVALGDVDGDADPDLVLANNVQPDRLYLDDGTGTFHDATAARVPASSTNRGAVALGDVDGDGDLDAAWAIYRWHNALYLNDGRGTYTDVTAGRMPADTDPTEAVAMGDVDGDGDLDLVFGNGGCCGQQNALYLNDGTGTFTDATAARMPSLADITRAVALEDVDGDGDLDLVVANQAQNRLLLNDGTGTFTDVTAFRMPPGRHESRAVAIGDVDGDGDPDLVFGNDGRQNGLYLNDGTGTFHDVTSGRLPADGDDTRAVVLGDVDGDGDLDLVLANLGSPAAQDRLYLNDGQGRYTDVTATNMPANTETTVGAALLDVDGDGDLDLTLCSVQKRLYLNDGSGTFTDVTAIRMPSGEGALGVAQGDVDGDGDGDLVFVGLFQNSVYLNLLRQRDAPVLLRAGHTYTLEAYSRYGPSSLSDVALPMLSTATANIPVPPFGTFGLAPAQTVTAAPIVISQPAGVGSITFTVPAAPSLAGLSLYAQALLVSSPFPARLTNVTADQLIQ